MNPISFRILPRFYQTPNRNLNPNNQIPQSNPTTSQNTILQKQVYYTSSNSPQVKNRRQEVVEDLKNKVTLLIKTDELTFTQKSNLQNITTFLQVVQSDKFSTLLGVESKFKPFNNAYMSHFFRIANSHDVVFTTDDIVTLVEQAGLALDGQEEALAEALLEFCKPQDCTDCIIEDSYELSPQLKSLFEDYNIIEQPSTLKVIALLLANIQNSPHLISDEQKKRILDILKDGEDKNDTEDFKFDWAEISNVV